MTHEEYLTDRAMLDALNRAIDEAPMTAKPVFRGITQLHKRVFRYEREHRIVNHDPQ